MFRKEILNSVILRAAGSQLSEEAAVAAFSEKIESFLSELILLALAKQTNPEGSPVDLEESLLRDLENPPSGEPTYLTVANVAEALDSLPS
jgi:hypothetical protein